MFFSVVTCVKTASRSMDKRRLSFTIVSLVFECHNILTTASISVKRHMITINREISSKLFMEIQTDAPNFLQIIFFSKKHNQRLKWKSVFLGSFNEAPNSFCQVFPGFWSRFWSSGVSGGWFNQSSYTCFLSIKADPSVTLYLRMFEHLQTIQTMQCRAHGLLFCDYPLKHVVFISEIFQCHHTVPS